MTLGQSIRSSTQWLLAGNVGSRALSFVFGIILARLLVPEDFGLLVTVQIFTGVAGLVAGGGMGQALIRSKDATDHDFNVVFTMQLGICSLIYAFFFAISPYFAVWYDEPRYESLLRVTALSFLLRPLVGNHNTWLNRNMRFKVRAIIGFTSGLVTSISSVYMAWIGMGVWSLALSGMLGSLFSWVLLTRQTPLRIRLAFDRNTASRLGGTGVKFSLLDIVTYLRSQINNFVIGRMANAETVGLFNKADSFAALPFSTVGSAVYQPVFRTLAAEQGNLDKSKYLYFRTIALLFAYTLPICIVLSWQATPLITTLYGANWAAAAAPLSILAWAWLSSAFNQPAGALLAAQNKLSQELLAQFITLLLNALACVIGIRWGLTGVALGLVIARVYLVVHMGFLVRKCIRSTSRDYIASITPGLTLGAGTALGLGLVELAQTEILITLPEPVWLLISLTAGGLAFGLMMLFAPISALRTESVRWKQRLHLPVTMRKDDKQ